MAFYCFQLLKESVSPKSDMSACGRVWGIVVGAIGTVLIDPVCSICKLAGCDGRSDDDGDYTETYG